MRQFNMTWNDKSGRWFKKFHGKPIAVSVKKLAAQFPDLVSAETKIGSYRAANEWWRIKEAQLTLEANSNDLQSLLQQQASLHWESTVAGNTISISQKAVDPVAVAELADRIKAVRATLPVTTKTNSPSLTIQAKSFVDSRDVGAGRRDIIRGHVEHFKAFKADDTCQIDGLTVSGFKAFLLAKVEAKQLSRVSAYHIMSTVKLFIRWLYHTAEILDRLPKNIDEKDTNIKMPTARAKKPFDNEMVSSLLAEVEGQQRLYYLLMLNTGMTQQDIADLTHSEVDWKQGRIIRQRSKTGDDLEADEVSMGEVPTVNYKLWPETFTLLKQYRSDDPNLVLLSAQKTPLVVREFKKTGKSCMRRIDSIGLQYRRLKKRLNPIRKKAGLPELRELKILRKTGSSKLDDHETYGRYVIHFLGQSPRTVAAKHYITPSQERFDDAVAWLGKQFGF